MRYKLRSSKQLPRGHERGGVAGSGTDGKEGQEEGEPSNKIRKTGGQPHRCSSSCPPAALAPVLLLHAAVQEEDPGQGVRGDQGSRRQDWTDPHSLLPAAGAGPSLQF